MSGNNNNGVKIFNFITLSVYGTNRRPGDGIEIGWTWFSSNFYIVIEIKVKFFFLLKKHIKLYYTLRRKS